MYSDRRDSDPQYGKEKELIMIKTVYFVPTTHHDLGYTHYIDELMDVYCTYYDSILDFCDRTADYPWEARYRYSVEEFWSLDYYLRHTSEANRRRMMHYVKEGRIELPALFANLIDGICTPEEIARTMYPSAAFAKECGVKIKSAALTDMPGMSDGMIAALSAAGVRYLFAGFPMYFRWSDITGAVPPMKHEYWDEWAVNPWGHPSAFKWQSISGGEMFVWYQDGYGWFGNDRAALVAHDTYEDIEANLMTFLHEIEEKGAPYTVMRYIDHGSDNEPPRMGISDIVRRWNEEHEDVKLVVATNAMFFEALEADCAGMTLPTVRGELPHTDYTTLSLTDAAVTAMNTRTKARALNLEKLTALTGNSNPSLFGEIYRGILHYDEHCFGMSAPFGNANEYNRLMKVKYAYGAARLCDHVNNLAAKEGNGLYCFSPTPDGGIAQMLSTEKIEEGEGFQCDAVNDPLLPIYGVTDAFANLLPGQKLYEYTAAITTDAMGIAGCEVGSASSGKRRPEGGILENEFYCIEYGDMGITRIFDYELGRDITDDIQPVGEVVFRDVKQNQLRMQEVYSVYRRKSGAVADSIVITASCKGAPQIITEVTLYHKIKRIDFSYRIILDRTPLREMYICFPFAANRPEFVFGGTDCEIRAFDDIVKGANTNQYAANRYAAVKSEDTIVLAMAETHVVSFGGLHPTAVSQAHHHLNPAGFTEPFIQKSDIQNAYISSMIAYNNCRTNFAASQLGEVLCRYSITSGKQVCAEAFADSFVHEPMLLRGDYTPIRLETGASNLRPICFKSAEDGDGFILRIRECSGRESIAAINLSGREIGEAFLCNLTEEKLSPCDPTKLPIGANQTVTIRIRFK